MTQPLSQRLEAWISMRLQARGLDKEIVNILNDVPLTVSDLREAAQLAKRVETAPTDIARTRYGEYTDVIVSCPDEYEGKRVALVTMEEP